MAYKWIFGTSALAALLPALVLVHRGAFGADGRPRPIYWALMAVAVAGPVGWTVAQFGGGWPTGLAMALWLTISVTIVIFSSLAALTRHAVRLTVLVLPYLFGLGVIAVIWSQAPGRPLLGTAPDAWIGVHIVVSVLTYALLTLAAVAGLAVFLQERALKNKRLSALNRQLPSVADAEDLQVGLLIASVIVLGAGLLTGMATQYMETGSLLVLSHKTVFSLLAFVVICALLGIHYRTGIGGRRAARLVLLAYLLLTLGYPGVKFVTDVLLA
jgi:ABC-type uncharacterized transport system permease subunit